MSLIARHQEDARQTLYFAHLFSADYVLSTVWTAYFAAVWWWHTPHDGARQANSQAQADLVAAAKLAAPPLPEVQRVEAARAIWAREQGTAFAVILLSWFSKIYLALLIYSYAMHLRKGTYRALARTVPPQRPVGAAAADGAVLPEDDDEDVEDFYRVPLRTPPAPNSNAHLRTASLSTFADIVGDSQKRAARPPPSKASAPEDDDDELLFDDDYQYASSGTTSKATSKRGTESSSTDNEDDAGERATFVPSWSSRSNRA